MCLTKIPGTILVIDDSEVNLELIALVLRKNNYSVLSSYSGMDGYNLACEKIPDLILLDISMPDIDGFKVCSMFKANPVTSGIPIIFLTSNVDKASIVDGFKLGAVDYLTKPFNKLELLARVKVHLQLRFTLKRIEDSEEEYRLLFTNMSNGFALHEIICDETGHPVDYRFLQINPAFEAITGLKDIDITGKTVKQIIPEIENILIENYGRVALTGESISFEHISKEFNKYFEVLAFCPKKGYFATVFSDVTDKRLTAIRLQQYNDDLEKQVKEKTHELEEALYKQQALTEELALSLKKEKELGELKTKFVSMASHEFKTPLTTIMSTCDILINFRTRYDEDKITDKLKNIKSEVIHMTKMIESVLHMGRPMDKESPIVIEPIVLKNFIETLTSDFSISDNYRHKIIIDINEDISLGTDNVRLKMIVTNLISNAIKYSTENTEIIIKAWREDLNIVLSVRDFGIGIPADQIGKLFEPFQRFSNVGNIKGTGLGLSIIKRETGIIGGTVVYNKDIEKGCEFIITIPDNRF